MRLKLLVDLSAEQEQMLRELTAQWASAERMTESNASFEIEADSCIKRGIRQAHEDMLLLRERKRRQEAA
jgi:hypothetical protein